jgi:hypothetical protein
MDPKAEGDFIIDAEGLDEAASDDLSQQQQTLNSLPESWGLTDNNSTAERYDQLQKWTREEVVVESDAQELRSNAGALFRRYTPECIREGKILSWAIATSLFKEWVQTTMPGFAVSAGFSDQLFVTRADAKMITFPKHTYHHGTCLLFAPSIAQFGLMPSQSHRRGSERACLPRFIWCNAKYHPSKAWSQRVELGALLGREYIGYFLTCSCCVTEKDLQQTQAIDVFIVEFEQSEDQLNGVVIMPRVIGVFKPPSDL